MHTECFVTGGANEIRAFLDYRAVVIVYLGGEFFDVSRGERPYSLAAFVRRYFFCCAPAHGRQNGIKIRADAGRLELTGSIAGGHAR
jgi:hypothetical protein